MRQNTRVMPFARLQLRPLCTLPLSVDYVLRSAKNSRYYRNPATVRFLPPIFIVAGNFYGCSATRHLPFCSYLPNSQALS